VYSGSAFLLAAQLIRHAGALREGDPRAQQYAALSAHLQELIEPADLNRVTDFLAELVKAQTTSQLSPLLLAARNDQFIMHQQLRLAFDDWLGALCKRKGPLLFDARRLALGRHTHGQLFRFRLKKHPESPVMVIGLARPEVLDNFPKLWSEVSVQEIQLQSLKRRASERLAREVLGDQVDADTIDRIVRQSDGNAFFLEELIRQVADSGGTVLPESVIATVQARLEGLEAEARRILRAASVFGEVFWEGAVQSLVGESLPSQVVASWLDFLVEREMLYACKPEKFPKERTFEFATVCTAKPLTPC